MSGIQFSSLGEFLLMGKYTFHVWSVYFLFAVLVAANLITPLRQKKIFIAEQKRRARRDQTIAGATGAEQAGVKS
ncbi:MAG: heme exporter protein CcmD [Pseudomonadales bacterium]|nr:heme exporter protein CcmD [Pseudomonadales bacterium]